jgi:hypothetical protein
VTFPVPTHLRYRKIAESDRQVILQFGNGWGVSVITGPGAYGGREGRYEIAVLRFEVESSTFSIVGNDVVGWLTEDEVTDLVGKIAVMPGAHRALSEGDIP